MTNLSELIYSSENICRLCAEQNQTGHALSTPGSGMLDKLVLKICCFLGVEHNEDKMLPKWLCSRCQLEATHIDKFIRLVQIGQDKLKELLTELKNETVSSKNVDNDVPVIKQEKKVEKLLIKSRKTHRKLIEKESKTINTEINERTKRIRRQPKRLLDEIELKVHKRDISPLIHLDNKLDCCALITSQPIAELRTETGITLGEILEVEENASDEKFSAPKIYFICEYCKETFRKQNDFLNHLKTHNNCTYECTECLQGFLNKNEFTQHQQLTGHLGVGLIEKYAVEQQNKENSNAETPPATAAINIVVGANGQITSIDTHMSGIAKVEEAGANQSQSVEDSGPIVVATRNLQKNKRLKNYIYACLVCQKKFDDAATVRRHYKVVHVGLRAYPCTFCSSAFKTKYSYDIHLMTHTGKKRFCCCFCQKPFKTSHEMKVHSRVHTGDKPYKCTFCSMGFTTRSNLASHQLVHTGERPHKCTNCEASFRSTTQLKKHKKMHLKAAQRRLHNADLDVRVAQKANEKNSGPSKSIETTQVPIDYINLAQSSLSLLKPRSCAKPNLRLEYCTEVIEQPKSPDSKNVLELPTISTNLHNNLIGEIKNTDKTFDSRVITTISSLSSAPFKFRCIYCQKQFKQSCALGKHLRTHTGERPYKCPMCPKSFADPSNFKKHKTLHKNATFELKSAANTTPSATMQEIRQMLAEQSLNITNSSSICSIYAASDPDPDGLETLSRLDAGAGNFSLSPSGSEFDDVVVATTQSDPNSQLSTALENVMALNEFDHVLPVAKNNSSLLSLADVAVTTTMPSSNQFVCISYLDPINPVGKKTTTFYVVN